MKAKYYNNGAINEIVLKCRDFGCNTRSLFDIAECVENYEYKQRVNFEVHIYCKDDNFYFKNGTKKQYIAALYLSDAMPYRSHTIKEVIDFINSIN